MRDYPPGTAAMLLARATREAVQPFMDELLELENSPDLGVQEEAPEFTSEVSHALRQLELAMERAARFMNRNMTTVVLPEGI